MNQTSKQWELKGDVDDTLTQTRCQFMVEIRDVAELSSKHYSVMDLDCFLWNRSNQKFLLAEAKSWNCWPEFAQRSSLERLHRALINDEYYCGTFIVQSERLKPSDGLNTVWKHTGTLETFGRGIWQKFAENLTHDQLYREILPSLLS